MLIPDQSICSSPFDTIQMHHNIRYQAPEGYQEEDERPLESISSFTPYNHNYDPASQASHRSITNPIKSRSKHQSFKPSLRSEQEESEGFPTHSNAVSEYGGRHSRRNNGQAFETQSQLNYNQFENRYQTIQLILKEENSNLKEQTELLLQELRKVTANQKKYKGLFEQTRHQLAVAQQERDSYAEEAQQLKIITKTEMRKFESHLNRVSTNPSQQQELMSNGINDIRSKILMAKSSEEMSDNTNSETMY